MDKDILNTFYDYVIPGALKGEIDCELPVHIIFNVITESHTLLATDIYDIDYIPSLKITNYDEFNTALINYVKTALPFYEDFLTRIDKKYHLAYIISLSFVQMDINDYKDPITYFKNKTKALLDFPLTLSNDFKSYGYNDSLKSDVYIKIDKETPYQESPYKFMILLSNDDGEYSLQTIRFHIIDDTVYIGAVQHEKLRKDDSKIVRRRLFKANENIGNDNSLIEINPGSIVAFTIFFSYMNANNYFRFKSCPKGIQRENDKKIHAFKLQNNLKNNTYTETQRFKIETIIERSEGYLTNAKEIATRLNTILGRINYHFDITHYLEDPQNNTAELITENIISCNNTLLRELYLQIYDIQKEHTLK